MENAAGPTSGKTTFLDLMRSFCGDLAQDKTKESTKKTSDNNNKNFELYQKSLQDDYDRWRQETGKLEED